MLIILNRFQQTFSVEAMLALKISDNFLVQEVETLGYRILFVILNNDIRRSLQRWRTDMKAHGLRPVHQVPRMVPDSFDVDSLAWIGDEDACDHVFGFVGEEVGRGVLGIQYLLVKVRCLLILKRQIAAQHCVENDPTAPNIAHKAIIIFAGNHLKYSVY